MTYIALLLASTWLSPAHAESLTLTAGEPIVIGAMEIDYVKAMVATRLSLIEQCADEPGKLVVKFKVKDGTVLNVKGKGSSFEDDAVGRCAGREVTQLAFPEANGNGLIIVSYPFQWVADGDEPAPPASE